MSIHEGHRERMRKQLKTSGMDSLSDVQVYSASSRRRSSEKSTVWARWPRSCSCSFRRSRAGAS